MWVKWWKKLDFAFNQNKAVLNPRGAWKCCFLSALFFRLTVLMKIPSRSRHKQPTRRRIYLFCGVKCCFSFHQMNEILWKKWYEKKKSFSCFADKILNWNEMKCYHARFFSRSRFSGRFWIGGSEAEEKLICGLVYFYCRKMIFREWRRAGLSASDVKIILSSEIQRWLQQLLQHFTIRYIICEHCRWRQINKQAHAVKCCDNKFKFSVFSPKISFSIGISNWERK